MRMLRPLRLVSLLLFAFGFLLASAWGQSSPSSPTGSSGAPMHGVAANSPAASSPSPWFLWEGWQAEDNRNGQAYLWNTSLGYRINRHFTLLAGVPYYDFQLSSGGAGGLGDAYLGLQMRSQLPGLRLTSTLTGTAPTGDRAAGLSSGRATVDFNNRFNHSFGRFVPFVDLGIANTITNESYFVRPVTTYGWVGNLEAGGEFYLTHRLGLGAAGYKILPAGSQNVYNRAGTTPVTNPLMPTAAASQSGGSSLDRDQGYGAWLDYNPIPWLLLEVSFSHSQHYGLNTVSFTTGYNLLALFHHSQ